MSWASNIGKNLIENMEITIGGIQYDKKINCIKCKTLFTLLDEDIEYVKLIRYIHNRNGNMKLCYECDKKDVVKTGGYNSLIGQNNKKK